MFKELLCAIALTGTIGASTPQNSSTDYQDVTITETYEYETNEVNSLSDLIVGNMYKVTVDLNNYDSYNNIILLDTTYVRFQQDDKLTIYRDEEFYLYWYTNGSYIRCYKSNVVDNRTYFIDKGIINFYILYESYNNTAISWENFSESDYLGEKSITITPKEFSGLYEIVNNFLYERIFSGGELNNINVTIFGTQMTMGQWLSTTTTIVILILIIVLLILLIKFIFKYVGGMMIWK